MPVTQNFTLYRGDSKTLIIQCRDATGAVFDLTDSTIKWWLARNPYSVGEDVLIAKSSAANDGIIIRVPATSGVIEVALNERDTDLEPGLFYHELKTFLNDAIATSMRGTVYVRDTLNMPSGNPLFAMVLTLGSPVFGAPALTSV